MKIIGEGLIYRGVAATRTASCCFPALARLDDGTLLATWRVGSSKDSDDGSLWLSSSNSEGRSWSAPREIMSCGLQVGCLGEPHYGPLTLTVDGLLLCAVMWVDRSRAELPFFNPTTEGILPLHTLFMQSFDSGETWSACWKMDAAPYDGPLAITGPLLSLSAGRLACPFEVNKRYDDSGPWRQAAAWSVSLDGGHTWPECVEIASDPSGRLMYWDAHVATQDQGPYVAAFWTFDREIKGDRPIHVATSDDLGRTWTAPRNTDVPGQVAEPLLFDGGRLLLLYVDRFGTRSIRAALSRDYGHTFTDDTLIYQQPLGRLDPGQGAVSADYLQDMDRWTFGRVQAVRGVAGEIWLVYYAGDSQSTGIYWARLAVT